MPLYELLEELFSIFEMNLIKDQDAYLFAFFDAVTDYLQSNSSELDGFIRYWDETLCSKTIPSGEVEGIRIFSIHKSKGLEFHTVLLPFCDWIFFLLTIPPKWLNRFMVTTTCKNVFNFG